MSKDISLNLGKIGSEMMSAAVIAGIQSFMRQYGIFLDGKLEGGKFKFDAYLAGKKIAWGEIHFAGGEEKAK